MPACTDEVVIVTGAAGFIGSYVCMRLLERGGVRVVGVDNFCDYYDVRLKESRIKLVESCDAGGKFECRRLDVSDAEAMAQLFSEVQPHRVVHLAAQAGVRYSLQNPRAYIQSNIVGFFNVIEQCRLHEIEHLVYASSSSVYGLGTQAPFSEQAKVDKPASLYAATKKSDELLASAYAHLYGIPCTGLRFFTVYGPWGRPDMAYYSFARKMAQGQTIRLFNEGNLQRDFTYVDDIVDGIMAVLDAGAPAPDEDGVPHAVYNIGCGDPVSLFDFVSTLEGALRDVGVLAGEMHVELAPMQLGDVYQTHADMSEFRRVFACEPRVHLAEGLQRFAIWFAQVGREFG